MKTKNSNYTLSVATTSIGKRFITRISFYVFLLAMILSLFSRCSLNTLVDENEKTKTMPPASAPGDVVGKVTIGYQGWFAATSDGSPINAWWHWTQNWSQSPSPGNNGLKSWPDVREYTTTYATARSNLNNGQQAKLYSNWNQRMRHATSNNPLGPRKYQGIYMNPTDSYANHGSIVAYKGKWYAFYHNSSLSNHDWLRSVRVDRLYYNNDGTIKVVEQTTKNK